MVAITVVLAAVLYVMVMGFGGDNGGQAPAFSVTKDASNKRFTVSINPATDISSFKVKVGDSTAVDLSALTGDLKFIDAGGDTKVSSGDYFTYTPGTVDTIVDILWVNGDSSQVVATFTVSLPAPADP